ncbi:MAG TPA: hypothetical protein VIG25_02715 [Pyrinomonadaceae bacterium]|jgi:cell division protein FtsB
MGSQYRPTVSRIFDRSLPFALAICLSTAIAAAFGDVVFAQNAAASSVSKRNTEDVEQLRRTIKRLTAENETLRHRVAQLEKVGQFNTLSERLTKEEQRSEDLQRQLLALGEKEASLQSHMDEVTEQLRPENIDQLPINGSLRPEQVREATRRRLTGEKQRVQAQLDLLQQSRGRLQTSLSVSDLLIQRLRAQLQVRAHP